MFDKLKSQQPYISYLFLAINILVYGYMLFKYGTTQNSYALLEMGANFNPLVIQGGQWWRLVTAAFIHIGFEHLLFNSISLLYLGSDVERILGHGKFFLLYLMSAIGGNLVSMAFNMNISAGASTALFGLFASYVVLGKLNPDSYSLSERAYSYSILILIQFVSGLMTPGIDNWGHFGGVVFGSLAILLFAESNRSDDYKHRRLFAMVVTIILVILLILFAKYILPA